MWLEMAQKPASNVLQLANFVKAPVSSSQINGNINRVRLEQLAGENKEVTTLYNMGITIGSNLNLNQVIWILYKECSRLIDTTNFAIVLYENNTNMLNFTLVFAQGRRVSPFSVKLTHSRGLTSQVLTNQTPLLIRDFAQANYTDEINKIYPDMPLCSWFVPGWERQFSIPDCLGKAPMGLL